jgi:hypothetical protein
MRLPGLTRGKRLSCGRPARARSANGGKQDVSARLGWGTAWHVFGRRMNKLGVRGWHVHVASLATVWLCLALWIRAKTVDQMSRSNAERRAIFVGLWPPMLWLIGDTIERAER